MKQILVLVLSSQISPYDKLHKAIKETWGQDQPGFQVIYYFGHQKEQVIRDNELHCNCSDSDIMLKTLKAFEYTLNNFKFDYIFRCCAGSYVVALEILKFIEDKPTERFYCGINGLFSEVKYASGSGFFLSPDMVKIILETPSPKNYGFDDVTIGAILSTKGIDVTPGARRADCLEKNVEIIPGQYHYHVRTDIQKMYDIHKKLTSKTDQS
jgi:hypothetical protein